jgi:hypothetical protein
MTTAADGTAFTGQVTIYITGDNGIQGIGSVGSGICTHEGNGYHSYTPAQTETNYTHIAFTFVGTGAITVTLQVYTAYPQSGDSFTLTTTVEDILRNKMEVVDATGAVTLYADNSSTPLLTGTVEDDSTTTTRTRLA